MKGFGEWTTKKHFIFPSNHCRLEPPTSDSSADRLSRVIQDCHYHILSFNSLPALYIFLNLFSYYTSPPPLFFFLFRIAIQWHNLQTLEVGHYLVEVEVECYVSDIIFNLTCWPVDCCRQLVILLRLVFRRNFLSVSSSGIRRLVMTVFGRRVEECHTPWNIVESGTKHHNPLSQYYIGT